MAYQNQPFAASVRETDYLVGGKTKLSVSQIAWLFSAQSANLDVAGKVVA
jgi:hypothetical protein